jgi:para-aminobenzoate synthetase component 1
MPELDIRGVLAASAEARPVLLEGRWLGRTEPTALAAVHPVSVLEGSAETFAEFRPWLVRHAAQCPSGGAIGYLAYELGRAFERVALAPAPGLPEFSFAYYDRIEQLPPAEWALPGGATSAPVELLHDFDRGRFMADVEHIRRYIAAGDIYQANLTQRFAARLEGLTANEIYARLAPGRAPMRALLKTPHASIVSDSPERFFCVRHGRILASPIKGTVARRGDPIEDEARRRQLLASAKDRAENVMIVDLLRNDLGRVCRYDTIGAHLWETDALPHLYHLVSHVEGELKPGIRPDDVLRALFPCGSITGAPKIRAMEILHEIEGAPRGVSMGAIGILRGAPASASFEMDFSVAIRTITLRHGVAAFNVGCGIVYDSRPQAEYEEMLLKAQPLLEALGIGTSVAAMSSSPRARAQ